MQTTAINAMEHSERCGSASGRAANPWIGFFEDLSLGGDAYTKSSLLELIDEADFVYWEVRPGIEYDSELLIIECGEWRGRFAVSLPKHSA